VADRFALAAPVHFSEPWIGEAEFSACGRYRLWLTRRRKGTSGLVRLVWIMLNPSTASANPDGDPKHDDPTIRKCIGFARRWDYRAFAVVNLFDLIATDPADLWRAGPGEQLSNSEWIPNKLIIDVAKAASLVVCAWGSSGGPRADERARDLVGLLGMRGVDLSCLGLTKGGAPRHPSRLGYDAALEPYQGANG